MFIGALFDSLSQREIHDVYLLDGFPTPNTFIKFLYSIGLGFLIGRMVLLLTTKDRRTGLPRTTPLQYEEHDGRYYVISARGTRPDWYRKVARNPRVSIKVGPRSFEGLASCTIDPAKITDLLEIRLQRRPWLVGRILEAYGLSMNPGREEFEEYSKGLAMVEIRPLG
jgi:deazaflavin-dependent oxidoreductase (nitroreductase family)